MISQQQESRTRHAPHAAAPAGSASTSPKTVTLCPRSRGAVRGAAHSLSPITSLSLGDVEKDGGGKERLGEVAPVCIQQFKDL